MGDVIDDGCAREQQDRDTAIAVVRLQASPASVWHTHCQYCGDPTSDGKKFCSYGLESCATEHGWFERIRKLQGVV